MKSIKKAAFGCALALALVSGSAQANDLHGFRIWAWLGQFLGVQVEMTGLPSGRYATKAGESGSGNKAGEGGTGGKKG